MPEFKPRSYRGKEIDVIYDIKRCIHAAECVRALPEVFDTRARPWIQPEGAEAETIAEVVRRCPTGALRYERRDGGAEEVADEGVSATLVPNGPIYLRGAISIKDADGTEILGDVRAALCRCGASENKPFCDNSHFRIQFEAE